MATPYHVLNAVCPSPTRQGGKLYNMSKMKLKVDNLLDMTQAGKILKVSRQTVHTWVRDGTLRTVSIGTRRKFLLKDEVEKLAKEREGKK